VELRKVIGKRLRGDGVAADVHAVVAVTTGGSQRTHAASTQRVVQRSAPKRPRGGDDGRGAD
jgi:hypothetical protein